jgi:hemerythrin-like domain-containing protein
MQAIEETRRSSAAVDKESVMATTANRRHWILFAGAALLGAAGVPEVRAAEEKEREEMEVPAVEDLMREHGILRRALLVYSETASRLAGGKANVPLEALGHTATLFRDFGERYHERGLEEAHVFVPLIKSGGKFATLANTLREQHERGRQITHYISAVARERAISPADAAPLSSTLFAFVRMYEHHAAIEDTIVFPAWKAAISPAQYTELGEQFEELEHETFGKDGFEDALRKIASIEEAFGLDDLGALTAPMPPEIT